MLKRVFLSLVVTVAAHAQPQEIVSGITRITFDEPALRNAGLRLTAVDPSDSSQTPETWRFLITGKSTAHVLVSNNATELRGFMIHGGGIVLSSGAKVLRIRDFSIGQLNNDLVLYAGNLAVFHVTANLNVDVTSRTAKLFGDLRTTAAVAQAFGTVTAGAVVGHIAVDAETSAANAATTPAVGSQPPGVALQPGVVASDVRFCELYDLRQVGTSGDRIALAAATTSWNFGSQKLDWWRRPDWRHPYIVLNLYRIRDDRFEQLGQSWIKHGFFALSDSQCASECLEATNGTQLAPGCTDTYNTYTNADQDTLGPRFEVDPWQGVWESQGSHGAGHVHGPLDHRLTVRQSEIAPAQNAGATYFLEGYYVHYQDTNVFNSAAWKPITPVPPELPSQEWRFSMTGRGTPATDGFAIDAWANARKSLIAENAPPIEFISADGRSVLAAKAVPVGGNRFRYTYALLNVDMNRQIGAFAVHLPDNTVVSDVGFSAPQHTDSLNAPNGAPIDNAAWTSTTTTTTVAWRTTTNPIRWGTVYTFWFTAAAPPVDGPVEVTLFRDSSITISANSVVPGSVE